MLSIRTQKLRDTTVIHCVGRLAFPDADSLQALTARELNSSRLVLDLAEVTGVDAAGIGALVALREWSKGTGRTLKLMNLKPKVQALLELTKLKPAFEICSAREMLDLMCRAIHQTESQTSVRAIQEPSGIRQFLNPAQMRLRYA